MNTNPTPYALGSEDGEAFWFFGMLATMKATAEQTGAESLSSSRRWPPEERPYLFTSIRRTTSRSTS